MFYLKSATLITLLLFSYSKAHSKDLTDRIGFGYSDAFISSVGNNSEDSTPSVQVKYSPNSEYSFVGALHLSTKDDESSFGFLAKAHKIIFREKNMNFYLGGHLAFINAELIDSKTAKLDNESGAEFGALAGVEFFIPGLENLGITFEAGFGLTTLGDGITFKSIANHPLKAGMTFYF